MLIAEMAASYKKDGKTLYDALMDIYKKYGYYKEKTISITMPGKDGMEKMKQLTENIRKNPSKQFGGIKVKITQDYLSNKYFDINGQSGRIGDFDFSDVMKFMLEDEKTFVVVRPSGTEPKIKLYIGTATDDMKKSEEKLALIESDAKKQLNL